MTGPLQGFRVVEVSTLLAGPLASQMLGALGADVIKVESSPGGDLMRWIGPGRTKGMASQFLSYNRNKRSILLDLKNPLALDALYRLVATADVFLHNMRPPAAARLRITYQDLVERNRKLIYICAPGFRQDGPLRDRPAFDDLIQGMSGISGMSLRRDGEPSYVPFNIADKLAAYCMVSAVGMALLHRERTGEGQEVQVPMLETMLEFNSFDHLYGAVLEPPEAPGIGHPRVLSRNRRPFRTKDGFICVQAATSEQYDRLLGCLGRTALQSDPRFSAPDARVRNMNAFLEEIAAAFCERTTAEWQKILDDADIANAEVLTLDEMTTNPYLNETGFFTLYDHPTEGLLRAPSMATHFSKTPGGHQSGPPLLGEHTEAILTEIGLSADEISRATAPRTGEAPRRSTGKAS